MNGDPYGIACALLRPCWDRFAVIESQLAVLVGSAFELRSRPTGAAKHPAIAMREWGFLATRTGLENVLFLIKLGYVPGVRWQVSAETGTPFVRNCQEFSEVISSRLDRSLRRS